MSSSRLLPALCVLAILCGCGRAAAPDDAALLAQAVSDGHLLPQTEYAAGGTDYNLAAVYVGRLTREVELPASIYFPTRENLYFERSGGRLGERFVGEYSFVSKGDVLMTAVYEEEELRLEETRLMLQISEAERGRILERERMSAEIERFINNVGDLGELDVEVHALRLLNMQTEFDYMLFRHERERAENEARLADIRERLEGEKLVAPFDGVVTYVSSMRPNTLISSSTLMVTVQDYNTFMLEVSGAMDVLRFGDTVSVRNPAGEVCEMRVANDPLAGSIFSSQGVYLLQPPEGLAALDFFGNNYVTAVAFDVRDAVLAPTRAIQTADQKRFVYIYEDGVLKKRFVQTGFFNNEVTQILDGVSPGQTVLIN
jgi:multidrug efflux pump subunit AcrA (membrane-fusion protein)